MGISFERPLFLIILLPLILFTLIPFLKISKSVRRLLKHRISIILRIISIIVITALLSGFMTYRQTKKNSVIILADLSDSTKHVRDIMNEYIKKAIESKDDDTTIGLMTFAYDTVYEIPLSSDLNFTSFETYPKPGHTDIANAITMANAMMPSDTNRRIILLTDGKQTIGDAVSTAKSVASQGVRVDAILLETGSTNREIQINNIKTPDILYKGEQFEITVEIESSYKTDAILKLFSENSLKYEKSISLQTGTNRFVFTDTAESSGVKTYRAEVFTKEDDIQKNNRMYTFIKVLGTPKILIVDGTGNESHELVKMIKNSAEYDVKVPQTVPSTLENLRKYDGIILMNTQKSDLPDKWDDMLEIYVRQLGRGLLTIGGDQAYALGGWADTTLEKILPVNVYQRDEAQLTGLALSILIDNSGSMGSGHNSPLELAKDGAARAVKTLKNIDEVSVIAFSNDAYRIAEMTPGNEKNTVIGLISRIPPGGGTMMYNAMNMAFKDLVKSNKTLKHIILLSDGQPADSGFETLAKKMKEAKITLTTISIGTGANSSLLSGLAQTTGGRNYNAVNASSLPDIMLQETFLSMGEYLNNETFVPDIVNTSPVIKGISSFSTLHGYIGTEIKGAASMVLATEESRPVYAEWQYGLGYAASFMSDLNGKWSSDFLLWNKGQEFVQNMISRILPSEEDPDSGKVEITRKGDKGVIKAFLKNDLKDTGDNIKTVAKIVSPEGEEIEVPLALSGLGTYEGSFTLAEEGSYVVNVLQSNGESILTNKESALAASYSDEYDSFVKSTGILEVVCRNANGKVWSDISDILKIKIIGAREYQGYIIPLFISAIVLILTDIAVRRLQVKSLIELISQKTGFKVNAVDIKIRKAKPVKVKIYTEKEEYNSANKNKGTKIKKDAEPVKEETSVSSLLKAKESEGRKKL